MPDKAAEQARLYKGAREPDRELDQFRMGIAKGPFPLDLRQNQIGFPALECEVMPSRDTRIDAYIAKSAAFAKPILEHLRALVHEACPDVEETLKWSAPHFTHAGKILAGMAAFKQHAGFIVPMLDASAGDASKRTEAMGHYGRITVLADLPARRVLIAQLKQAAKAIDGGAKLPNRKRDTPKPVPTMPEDFARALAKTAGAKKQFAAFTPGKQREYLEWITEAKQEATRAKRIAEASAWIAEGKTRYWKYAKW